MIDKQNRPPTSSEAVLGSQNHMRPVYCVSLMVSVVYQFHCVYSQGTGVTHEENSVGVWVCNGGVGW